MMLLQKVEKTLRYFCEEVLWWGLWWCKLSPETKESALKAVSEILEWVKETRLSESAVIALIDFVECNLLHASERLIVLATLPITARRVAIPPSRWTAQEFYEAIRKTYLYEYEDYNAEGELILSIPSLEEVFTSSDDVYEKCKNIRNFAKITLHALKLKN